MSDDLVTLLRRVSEWERREGFETLHALAADEIERLRARIAALEEALTDLLDDVSGYEVTLNVYRAARAALEEKK